MRLTKLLNSYQIKDFVYIELHRQGEIFLELLHQSLPLLIECFFSCHKVVLRESKYTKFYAIKRYEQFLLFC